MEKRVTLSHTLKVGKQQNTGLGDREEWIRRGRCQDDLRVFNQKHKEYAICEYEIIGKGANLI